VLFIPIYPKSLAPHTGPHIASHHSLAIITPQNMKIGARLATGVSTRRFPPLLVNSTGRGQQRTACMSTLPAPGVVLTRNDTPVPCEMTSGAWLAAAPRGAYTPTLRHQRLLTG